MLLLIVIYFVGLVAPSDASAELFVVGGSSVADINEWFEIEAFSKVHHDLVVFRKISEVPPTCYEYKVTPKNDTTIVLKTKKFCYPSIIITGRRKCGTSAVYQLLSASLDVVQSNLQKEYCMMVTGGLLGFLDGYPEISLPGKQILSGCPDLGSNMRLHSWLQQPKVTYIYLTRDYADWLWAAYNYWCVPHYEHCSGTRTSPALNIRNPEDFHQLVLATDAANITKQTPVNFFDMHGKSPCESGNTLFSADIRSLWQHVSPKDTLILASEEIEEKLDDSVTKIATLANITFTKEAIASFGKVRYNTQISEQSKMAKSAIAADQMVNGRYAISGFRPMLNETKQLLDRCWLKDCIWVSAITGRAYEACSSGHAHYDALFKALDSAT